MDQIALGAWSAGLTSTAHTAHLSFENKFPVVLSSVKLTHQYGSSVPEIKSWRNVQPGRIDSYLETNYKTGFGTKSDYWSLEFQFQDGVKFFVNGYSCNLEDEDDFHKAGTLYSYVDQYTFQPGLKSGCGGVSISQSSNSKYNSYAFVQMKNDLPVDAQLTLYHHYSDFVDHSKDFGSVSPSATTAYWPVYYLSGFGHTDTDHWKVAATFKVEPPSDAVAYRGKKLINETPNWKCELSGKDAGEKKTFSATGAGLKMGSCSDKWKTPLEYNTVAFVRLKNLSGKDAVGAVLKHQYSSDTTYEYDYGIIDNGKVSNELYMMEYFTGATHPGYDYWTLRVFFTDGSYYDSSEAKRCYLTSTDAGTEILFTFNNEKLFLGLDGSCKDDMTKAPHSYDLSLGIDPNRAYNENCFLGAHNAFANMNEGYYLGPNQAHSIRTQMFLGVTTLLIDLWEYQNDIYMLHEWGNPWTRYFSNDPWAHYVSLVDGLTEVARFLKHFPKTVITIVIEDKLGNNKVLRSQIPNKFAAAGLGGLTYVLPSGNNWPQVKDLYGKVVVFTSGKKDPNYMKQWQYMTETVYGDESLNPKNWTMVRNESQPLGNLPLLAMNHFPKTPVLEIIQWNSFDSINSKESFKAHIDDMGHARSGTTYPLIPNFINADFIDLGHAKWATKYCNSLLHHTSPPPMDAPFFFFDIQSDSDMDTAFIGSAGNTTS